MTQARAGRQVDCVVTDVYGNAVTTATVAAQRQRHSEQQGSCPDRRCERRRVISDQDVSALMELCCAPEE